MGLWVDLLKRGLELSDETGDVILLDDAVYRAGQVRDALDFHGLSSCLPTI